MDERFKLFGTNVPHVSILSSIYKMLKKLGRMKIKEGIGTKWVNMDYTSKSIWGKVFKNGSSKICGRQPLKNLKGYGQNILSHIY